MAKDNQADSGLQEENSHTPIQPGQHRATYARDRRNGGYIIRVEGPYSARFAGRSVPVTRMNGERSNEELDTLLWTGTDDKTQKPIALYSFKPKPRDGDLNDAIPF